VLPQLEPGSIRARCAARAPEQPETMDAILDDYLQLVEPTSRTGSIPAHGLLPVGGDRSRILASGWAAGLNSNVMFWRNAPASTEIEEVACVAARHARASVAFDGMFTDTASVSSLLSIVAARTFVPDLASRERGLAGPAGTGRLRLYCRPRPTPRSRKEPSSPASPRGLRRIPADAAYRMQADLLAGAIAEDRAAGWQPFCVGRHAGTTSSTSVDPVRKIAAVCVPEKLWLHVDAAYAGVAAIAPRCRSLRWLGACRLDRRQRAQVDVDAVRCVAAPLPGSGAFRDAFSLVPST